ncbi:Pyrroline-5-carboxylate reductase [Candidatus Magnetaquicoccaceae bacterium FCR-1]|uniref:Pyrroline-5-carboxylate reductase n=2 Tax=Candidatus Magnetaquiglobus chichijimensis TaxID=3141448 RepID=A0ABQ0CCR2_9PROT
MSMHDTITPAGSVIAFLGGGAMAGALIQGLIRAGVNPERIRVAEPVEGQRRALTERYGVLVFAANGEAVRGADVVVVAVKPGVVAGVLDEVSGSLASGTLVISIAAGVTLATLAAHLPAEQPLARVMPNTPGLVGAGISVLLAAPGCSVAQRILARRIMEAMGLVEEIEQESLMDGITALSGSGPAYVYLIAEALSDGGVASGLPRPLADRLAIRTLLGSARLLEESGLHPGVLKNQVTSPGGTTIAGLEVLERSGVRGALMGAVQAACQRSRELGKK